MTINIDQKKTPIRKNWKNHKGDFFKSLSNPKVQKYFPKTLNQNESIAFYEKIQTRYKIDGYCFWAVIRNSDSKFLGICGLLSQTIDGQKEIEVGYVSGYVKMSQNRRFKNASGFYE